MERLEITGWVNRAFLTEIVLPDAFCADEIPDAADYCEYCAYRYDALNVERMSGAVAHKNLT